MQLEEKIEQALLEYRRENLLGPGQLSSKDWTNIYKKAGMSDEEIADYRKNLQQYAKVMDDPLDAYRD